MSRFHTGWFVLFCLAGCGTAEPARPVVSGGGQATPASDSVGTGSPADAVVGPDGAVVGPDGAVVAADAKAASDAKRAADAAVPPPKTDIGKVCLANADCPGGLKCFEVKAATGEGICSHACVAPVDCPQGTHCNAQGGVLICTPPRYCNACSSHAECGGEASLCLKDKFGKGYCTTTCSINVASCRAGSSCVQYGSTLNEFACRPDYGACKGGGEHCSPCTTPQDCGAGTECYGAKSGERFCAQLCDPTGPNACPQGFGCAAAGQKGFCFRQTAKDGLQATCAKGDKGYCDPCANSWECASGKCISKNEKNFCGLPTACKSDADCPYGKEATFCVPTSDGMACVPPPAWHCQGFKLCLGYPCKSDEKCDNGICKPK